MASTEWKIRRLLSFVKEDGRRIKQTLDNLKSELDLSGDRSSFGTELATAPACEDVTLEREEGVTSVRDREFFRYFLQKELLRCENYGYPLSIMRIEVCWPDEGGYNGRRLLSEAVLQECTRNLESCIRRSDKVTQSRDGEFFILLPETDEIHTRYVLRRIGNKLNNHNASCPDTKLKFQIACVSCNDLDEVRSALKNLLNSEERLSHPAEPASAGRSRKIWN